MFSLLASVSALIAVGKKGRRAFWGVVEGEEADLMGSVARAG